MSELIRTSTRFTYIMSSLSGLDGNHATEDPFGTTPPIVPTPHSPSTPFEPNGSPQGFGFRS